MTGHQPSPQDRQGQGAPKFADFPLGDGETMADALERALNDCSGAEPSLSVLYIRTEQAVPVLRELHKYLATALGVINAAGIIWLGSESASNALAKSRGES